MYEILEFRSKIFLFRNVGFLLLCMRLISIDDCGEIKVGMFLVFVMAIGLLRLYWNNIIMQN